MSRLVLLVVVAAAVLAAGGTALAERLACDGGKCVGGDGPDTMYGSGVRGEIYSLKGGDLVRANAGSDLVNGDGGDDRLVGGRGDDAVHGSDGEDVVAGNPGNDRLTGGTGSDRIEAADGIRDSIFVRQRSPRRGGLRLGSRPVPRRLLRLRSPQTPLGGAAG